MSPKPRRHAEIAGAGFGGLVAAIALAQRGWSVHVCEKTPAIRAEGFAIAMQPNMLRVLESLGLSERVVEGGLLIVRRETRNERNEVTMSLRGQGTHRVSRQHIVDVLAESATRMGVVIEADSPVVGADPAGALLLAGGRRLAGDIVIGADGVHSAVRDSLGLAVRRRQLGDGATRTLVSRSPQDMAEDATLGPRTCEYWAGTRRVITSPCSRQDEYVVMSCLASDASGRAIPCDVPSWSTSFPHLSSLFERIAREADPARMRWTNFETVQLPAWHAGRVAVLGDAAHATPPNLGQGSGCAMMNALALAVALDEHSDIEQALDAWERREQPLTEHTQQWSMLYGRVTTWPEWARSLAFKGLGGIGWVRRRYQRTANHIPTGYRSAPTPAESAMP